MQQGIGGGVQITKAGILWFKTINNQGAPVVLQCPGLNLPTVHQHLFSLQVYLNFHGQGGTLVIQHKKAKLWLKLGEIVTIPIDSHSQLFYMHCLEDVQN